LKSRLCVASSYFTSFKAIVRISGRLITQEPREARGAYQ
jgi:hypothetical protein